MRQDRGTIYFLLLTIVCSVLGLIICLIILDGIDDPYLYVESPVNYQTAHKSVNIRGFTTPDTKVTVNGVEIGRGEDNLEFGDTVELKEGANLLEVKAERDGDEVTDYILVYSVN